MAATTQLLTKAPRTRKELLHLLGLSNLDPLKRYLKALEAEGLIEQKGRRKEIGSNGRTNGPGAMVYEWVKHDVRAKQP